MNLNRTPASRLVPFLMAPWICTAVAQITIVNDERGFLGNNKAQVTTVHNGTTEVSFDATGASKLVVAIGTEPGFNNNAVTGMTLSFNGVPMTLAVLGNTRGVTTNDAGGVGIFYLDDPFQGAATFTFGATTTGGGPEYGFGQIIGDHYLADDVLIIKTAWGGKSLAVDFRPPSAVAARGGEVGPFYQGIFDNVRDVLANLGTEFPGWSATGYQIVGFGWHQGWNDRVDQTYNDEYEANMKNFIDDVRTELGKPELPFVIATTGMNGPTETHPRALSLMNAQLAMADPAKYPEHAGNVDVIDTRDFWRDAAVSPVNQGYHWNQNAETYFLIGKSMGDRMVGLLELPN